MLLTLMVGASARVIKGNTIILFTARLVFIMFVE